MSNAKRRTLIAIQAILIAIFIIAIIGLSFGNAKADESNASNIVQDSVDAKNKIENLHVGGYMEAHDAATRWSGNPDVSAIRALGSTDQIQAFLRGEYSVGEGYTVGYLTGNITSYSWDGFFTKQIMANNLIFDGNGYSIYLNATWVNSYNSGEEAQRPWASFSDIYNSAENTFFKASSNHTDLDLNGAFVGYIPPSSSVVNTQFIVSSSIFTYSGSYQDGVNLTSTDGKHFAVNTGASGCGGYVAAYCSGTIDNCSITLYQGVYLRILKASTASTASMSRHSYALGGMVGVLAGPNATVSNCKVDMKKDSLLYLEINSNKQNNARAYIGGLIGWMGDGSSAYNLYCEGEGTLRGTTSGSTSTPYPLTFAGIAVGSAGATQDGATASDVCGTKTAGTINGVVSTWTGTAWFRSRDTNFTMNGQEGSNSVDSAVQGIIVGCEGKADDSNYKTSNIYFLGDPNYITVGYSYTAAAISQNAAGGRAVKLYNTVTVKESADSSTGYTTSSSSNVALRFSSTESSSPVWVSYDLSSDSNANHIFWAITANKSGGSGSFTATTEVTNYYNKFATAQQAMDYNFAYVELVRGRYSRVEIDVEIGRALYYSSPANSTLPTYQYGTQLSLPNLLFWDNAAHTKATFSSASDPNYVNVDYSYFMTVEGSSSQPIDSSGYKSAGTYTTFVYTDEAGCDDIDLINKSRRVVTYIQDNYDYQSYANAHPGYSYINKNTGKKDFDTWQPRYTQTITPKSSQVSIVKNTDITGLNLIGGIWKVQYASIAIEFAGSVRDADLVTANGDTYVSANIAYYLADDDYNPIRKVTSMINVGKYIIVAESLNNSNYTFDKTASTSYAKLEITEKPTMLRFNDNLQSEEVTFNGEKAYKIYLQYNGEEQVIKYASGEKDVDSAYMTQHGLAFYFFNVVNEDAPMIQFDVMGMHGEESYNAIDVPEDGEAGSYMVVISFADGDAASNYGLPDYTTFIVEITPIQIAFEEKTEAESTFIYGDITPESDEQRGYFAFALDNGVQIEPTSREYKIKVGNDWVDYPDSPRNVGTYQIIYKVEHAVERNYSDTEKTYEVTILPRPVTYTLSDGSNSGDEIAGNYVYGTEYTPGVGDYANMIVGSFGKYKSTTVNDLNGTGLSTTHGQNTVVGYRYQRVGNYGDEYNFQPYTDMDDIAKLPDKIQDAGIYVVYPILLFPAVGGYDYNEVEAGNYNFTLAYKKFAVQKLEVNIILDYEFTKEYSKEMPKYNGAANDENDRVWKYADGSNEFLEADEISVNLHFYANADSEVNEEGYKVSYSGCEGLDAYNAKGMNKADNYIVNATGVIKLTITALEVQVKTFSNVSKITYGDDLSDSDFSYQVQGENAFTANDLEDMEIEYVFYALGGEKIDLDGIDRLNAGSYEIGIVFGSENYSVSEVRATLTVEPKKIAIDSVLAGNVTVTYDGEIHYPELTVTFDGVVEGDDITVSVVFYDEDGKVVTNPQNAGVYTAKVEGDLSVLNASDLSVNNNYKLDTISANKATATVTINKRTVEVTVPNGVMFYLDVDSLTTNGEAFEVTGGDGFIGDDAKYYKLVPVNPEYALGTHTNGLGIEFLYDSNYDITVIYGDLEVVDNDLTDLGKYVTVTFDGEAYEDGNVVYTGSNLYSKFNFAASELLSGKLSFVITTDAAGNNTTSSVINAGTYYMVIVSGDGLLDGKLIIPVKVAKADRVISQSDISSVVHYNKLVFSSSLDNLQYKVGADGEWKDAVNGVFEYDATPLTNYSVYVRVKPGVDGNYNDSNEIVINKVTGIDVGDVVAQIEAFESVTFSNVASYRELLKRIELVSDDDISLIDTAKIDRLAASYEALITEANSVIAGAQSVTAKAVGRGNGSVATTALGITGTGLGLSAVGLMLGLISVKKRKEDEEKTVMKNRAKTVKIIVAVMLIAIIAVCALAGCEEKQITQEEVLNLASFKTPSNENMRAYEITVYHDADLVYQNFNGEVESIDGVTAPDFNLSSSGSGFDFNIDYFDNTSFITSRTTATFSADIVNVSAFLGRPNATNATVTVVVDAVYERLSKIEISYDEGSFSTKIVSTMLY